MSPRASCKLSWKLRARCTVPGRVWRSLPEHGVTKGRRVHCDCSVTSMSQVRYTSTIAAAPTGELLGTNIQDVPRIDVKTLQAGDLISKISSPILITGVADSWPARHCWNVAYLARVHGDMAMADLRLPDDLFDDDDVGIATGNAMYADHLRNAYVPFVRKPTQFTLRDYLCNRFDDYLFEISEFGAAGRLCKDAFGGRDHLPELFAADDLSQLTFGVGPAGEGVMFHAHTAAWNALMFGEKEWYIYQPDALSGWIYDDLAMLESRALPQATTSVANSVERAVPELMRCRQRAGEVIFIPDGWWHATCSHTATACLGGQRHKDRLPSSWAADLMEQWPESGLALIAVAKERGDSSLFEEAIRKEPFNLRFAVEYIDFLKSCHRYVNAAEIAMQTKTVMERARRQKLLSRCELAAILAQLAERLYHVVDAAAHATSDSLTTAGNGKVKATFTDMLQVSATTHAMVDEALKLDAGAPMARQLAQVIQARARSVDLKNAHGSF